MSAKKPTEPSPEGIARSDRKRLAAEEGARALADVERQAIEVRTNLARLRQTREAKEAADADRTRFARELFAIPIECLNSFADECRSEYETACIPNLDGQPIDARERFKLLGDVGNRQHRFNLGSPLTVQIQAFFVYGERLAIPDIKTEVRHLRRPVGLASSLRFPGQPFSFQLFPICMESLFCFLVLSRHVLCGLLEQFVRLISCFRRGMLSHCFFSLLLVMCSRTTSAASWCSAYCWLGLLRLGRSIRPRSNSLGPSSRSRLRNARSSAVVVVSSMRSIVSPATLRARSFWRS